MKLSIIILAAGKGTRMQSMTPKVLHEVGNISMLDHVLNTAKSLEPDNIIIVTGHGSSLVETSVREKWSDIYFVEQKEQLGTAHAVLQAQEHLKDYEGKIVILYADTPFITKETILNMLQESTQSDLVVLGFETDNPDKYGRLIIENNQLEKIVEFKDATEEERKITLCNSGVLLGSSQFLFECIRQVDNKNASEEFYLTDCIEISKQKGKRNTVVMCPELETMGVNSKAQLAVAENIFQNRKRAEFMDKGVTLIDPSTVYFSYDTDITNDVVIEPNVYFGKNVKIEQGVRVKSFCHIEGARIASNCVIGPFARIRPNTDLSNNVKVGNFVETKNVKIGEGSKVSHLSYIGDAEIGELSNVGAGTITCNYDGYSKHKTVIGSNVFIGSNTMLVAPVRLEDNSMTASGSVVTEDVSSDSLAVARSRQINKINFVNKFKAKNNKNC